MACSRHRRARSCGDAGLPAEPDPRRACPARLAGVLLYDPINIRYATDSTNMQLWVAANATRLLLRRDPRAGRAVRIFPASICRDDAGMVDEVRPATPASISMAATCRGRRAQRWAERSRISCPRRRRQPAAGGRSSRSRLVSARLLPRASASPDGEAVMEEARMIKSPDEILCMRRSIAVCEAGMARDGAALGPGITENALWAELHREQYPPAASGSRRGCWPRARAPIRGSRSARRESSRLATWSPSTPT